MNSQLITGTTGEPSYGQVPVPDTVNNTVMLTEGSLAWLSVEGLCTEPDSDRFTHPQPISG